MALVPCDTDWSQTAWPVATARRRVRPPSESPGSLGVPPVSVPVPVPDAVAGVGAVADGTGGGSGAGAGPVADAAGRGGGDFSPGRRVRRSWSQLSWSGVWLGRPRSTTTS